MNLQKVYTSGEYKSNGFVEDYKAMLKQFSTEGLCHAFYDSEGVPVDVLPAVVIADSADIPANTTKFKDVCAYYDAHKPEFEQFDTVTGGIKGLCGRLVAGHYLIVERTTGSPILMAPAETYDDIRFEGVILPLLCRAVRTDEDLSSYTDALKKAGVHHG